MPNSNDRIFASSGGTTILRSRTVGGRDGGAVTLGLKRA
jgi:hypothetical protein